MIYKCDSSKCYSPFQDSLYGIGMRVMNQCKDVTKVRCTICSIVHTVATKKKVDNSKIMGVTKK